MSYDITEALQKMEEELIQSMKRNLQRHLDEEDDEGFDWAQWQAEKLNSIARYRAQNRKIIGDYTSTIPQQIDDMIRKSYETGKQQEEIRILKAIRQGYLAASAPAGEISTGFFAVNERKLNALVKATQGEMHKGISSILRYQDDIYRKTIFRSAAQFNMGGLSLGQAVDATTKDFLAQGIQNIRYKDGRCVNIASYAEMVLRTANLRANIQGEAAKRDVWGICTVKLSAHGSACPKCIPWQGKVYYDDVYSSIPVPKDGKYPLLSTAIEGGALHPNCKNGVHTWFEGINELPREMTQEEIDEANRRYDLEQQQRYCERNVRKYKRMKLGAIDPENAAKYAAQEQAWRKRLNNLVKENKDVLRIDYRRLKVYDAPAPPAGKPAAVPPAPKPKAAKAKAHTESVSAGHAVEVAPPTPKDNGGTGKTYSPEKIGGKSLTSGGDGGIIEAEYKRFHTGEEVNDFFYYDSREKRSLLQKRKSTYGRWKSSVTSDQESAISDYCADGYDAVNSFLRKNNGYESISEEYVKSIISDLDSAIGNFDVRENFVTYRGSSIESLLQEFPEAEDFKDLVGRTYHDNAYMSTSPIKKVAEKFATQNGQEGIVLEISVPKGKGLGGYINEFSGFKDDEYEFLLKRGTFLEIYEVDESGNIPILKCRWKD